MSEGTGAKGASRGVALLGGAKLFFVLSGFVLQFALPRVLEDASEYGLYATAMAFTAIVTNTLTASLVQTTSLYRSSLGGGVRGLAVRHAALGLVGASLLVLLAEPLGRVVLRDPLVVPMLRLGALVVAAYALYATAIGALNGSQRFASQAALDAGYSALRTTVILAGAAGLGGALGAFSGFAGGTVLAALIGATLARLDRPGATPGLRAHAAMLLPIAGYQLALNLLLQLDVAVLKALAGRAEGPDAAELASHVTGLYRAAQSLAFVPYQLTTSVTLVLFPLVARASASGDDSLVRTVQSARGFLLVLLASLLGPLIAAPRAAIRLVFPDDYLEGAEVLPVLAAGQLFFALAVLQATVLVGRRDVLRAAGSATAALLLALLAQGALVLAGVSASHAVACGSALGAFVFASMTAHAVRQHIQASLDLGLMAKVAGSVGVAGLLGRWLPQGSRVEGLMTLTALAGVIVLSLVVSRAPRREWLNR